MAIVTNINTTVQSISDKTIELYGDLSLLFKLVDDNPILTGYTDTVEVGVELSYDDNIAFLMQTTVNLDTLVVSTPQISSVTIQQDQSIYDVAIQLYGDITGVFQLLNNNTSIDNLNDYSIRGNKVTYVVQGNAIAEYFRVNNTIIVSGIEALRNYDDSFDLSFN